VKKYSTLHQVYKDKRRELHIVRRRWMDSYSSKLEDEDWDPISSHEEDNEGGGSFEGEERKSEKAIVKPVEIISSLHSLFSELKEYVSHPQNLLNLPPMIISDILDFIAIPLLPTLESYKDSFCVSFKDSSSTQPSSSSSSISQFDMFTRNQQAKRREKRMKIYLERITANSCSCLFSILSLYSGLIFL